ncbi:hypothetical protein GOODEAATRI_018161, partial [Goodea atripinnis]
GSVNMATTAQLFEVKTTAYIERLAWRTPGGGSKGGAEAFDPKRLLDEFKCHIEELKQLDEKIQRKVEKLEQQCHREAKEFAHKVQDLQRSNQVAFQHFQELDEHISYVATKVCHLGDQLEGVNTPRQRAVEAQRLMTYFNEFLDGDLRSDVFNNPDKVSAACLLSASCLTREGGGRLLKDDDPSTGDTAGGLPTFCLGVHLTWFCCAISFLPPHLTSPPSLSRQHSHMRCLSVTLRLRRLLISFRSCISLPRSCLSTGKYHDLERQLIQEFTAAQRRGEIGRMREVAAVLLHFKGYAHCVDVYIKQCQEGAYIRNDVFEDTAALCQRVNKQVGEVFSSPETVMAKLIQNIFENKLQILLICPRMPSQSSSCWLNICVWNTSTMPWRLAWQACSKVCAYVSRQVDHVRKSMDGKNVDTVLTELGIRFHRLIHEHLQQFSYSSMGGMLAICDVAEYRRCAKDFRVPLVLQLFDTLHALCNLLVVAPDNLKQVCSGEHLTNLDRNLLHAFVQLRVDYRSARLGRHFS